MNSLLTILRKTLAVILGLVAGMSAMMAIETGMKQIYGPLPAELTPETLRKYIDSLPLSAFLMVLLSHQSGSFIASAVATLIAGHRWLAGAIGLGVLYTLAGIANAMMIPLPVWFIVIDLPLYMIAALAGCYLAGLVFKPKPQTSA